MSLLQAYQKWARMNRDDDKILPGLEKYSPEQLFFINSARLLCSKTTVSFAKQMILLDEHSPEQIRYTSCLLGLNSVTS